jgi:hypothetical protein
MGLIVFWIDRDEPPIVFKPVCCFLVPNLEILHPLEVLKKTVGLSRACNLTSFSLCLTGPVDYLFASRHKGLSFKSPGGYLQYVKPGFSR